MRLVALMEIMACARFMVERLYIDFTIFFDPACWELITPWEQSEPGVIKVCGVVCVWGGGAHLITCPGGRQSTHSLLPLTPPPCPALQPHPGCDTLAVCSTHSPPPLPPPPHPPRV